jgi:aminoglycoside phosphotransferase (APT) family kinase protein
VEENRSEHAPVEALIGLVADATGTPPAGVRVAVRPPLDHQSNRLYDVWAGERRLVAKEFLRPAQHATAPPREHGALERLADLDIAPRAVLIASTATPPLGPVVVYEYMEGEPWGRRRPTDGRLRCLADTWLVLHGAPTEGLSPTRGAGTDEVEGWLRQGFDAYGEWVESAFPAGRRALDLCLEVAERRRPLLAELRDHEPVLCFCRSDARFANFVDRPDGRVGMIDWEDSGLDDPARDLADLALHPNQEDLLSSDDLRVFLDRYLAGRAALDPHLERRMQLYVAALSLLWPAWLFPGGVRRARAGRLGDWSVNGLPANRRLRRYLARALAWPRADAADEYDSLADVVFFPAR